MLEKYKNSFYQNVYKTFDYFADRVLRRRSYWSVQEGFFKGMLWGTIANCSTLPPKLLGTYEKEVQILLAELPIFDLVIDVGAAEGWYAVGLLYRQRCRKVIAYEMTVSGRSNMQANIQRNHLSDDSIEIRGECTTTEFRTLLGSLPKSSDFRLLVICDCEGFEDKLLKIETIEDFSTGWFIVETHDYYVPDVHGRLVEVFSRTHTISQIYPARRTRQDLPINLPWVLKLPIIYRFLLSERRCPNIAWIIAYPKQNLK